MSSDALPFADLDKVFPDQEGKPKPLQMPGSGGIKLRVLIGDDDPVHTLTLFHCLAQAGYEVVVAETGTDAIAELRKADHPPVAILDGKLPGMNGREICARMRDVGKNIYLILTGENPTTQEIVAGLESGADLYLPKSIPPEEMLAHVKVGVRIVSRQQALALRIGELAADRLPPED